MTDLQTLPGGTNSFTAGINERGNIVGGSETVDGQRAALWRNGRVINLGTLEGDVFSEATAINNRGDIVGESCGEAVCHAVLWTRRDR